MTKYFNILLVVFGFLAVTSCVDNVIDEPPVKDFLELETNATIQDILDVWEEGEILPIEEDLVFDAIVVADDESGNFYKSLVLQDETGGISVRIEANNIYAVLPQGRKVFVRAQGLFVGDFAGLPQIGYNKFVDDDGDDALATLPFVLIGDTEESVIVPNVRDQEIAVNTVSIGGLNQDMLNTVVKLENVQFSESELGSTFANALDPVNGVNRTLEDCEGNSIVVRTSDFCDFAGDIIPDGNGDLTGIYTVFGSTKQFTIRNTTDVLLNGERCGEVVIEVPDANATIGDLLALYVEGAVTPITTDMIFDGIVTANDISGNFYKQIVIEDENDAINIQIDDFDLFQTFNIGRRVVVKAENLAVGDFNGLPQIGINGGSQVSRIPAAIYPSIILKADNVGAKSPTVVSVADLQSGTFYNKLIRLEEVEFVDAALGSTYADADNMFSINHDLTNCDDETIILRSSGFADFADVTLPTGNGTVTAIFTVFSGTRQLALREVSDVSLIGDRCDGGGNPGELTSLEEDFESVGDGSNVSLNGWTNTAIKGERVWRGKEFSGNTYVQATAFQDDQPEMETWLITPKVTMNGNNELSFRSAIAFHNHESVTVYISADFDGDVNSATWTELSPTLAGSANANYDWVESGKVDLSSYSGEIVIGFKYEGSGSGGTTSFILDDLSITK